MEIKGRKCYLNFSIIQLINEGLQRWFSWFWCISFACCGIQPSQSFLPVERTMVSWFLWLFITCKTQTSTKYFKAALAKETLTLRRSTKADGVMTFIYKGTSLFVAENAFNSLQTFGTSVMNLFHPSSSNKTLELSFSLCLDLFHFYSLVKKS